MLVKIKSILIIFFAVLFLSAQVFAQQEPQNFSSPKASSGTRKQMATIILSGLGGAILGLSTLSFYGRPQDKLANIAIGFALGVIGGTVIVTYKAATIPRDGYAFDDSFNPLPLNEDQERVHLISIMMSF